MLTADLVLSEIHYAPRFGNDGEDLYFEVRGTPNAPIRAGTYMIPAAGDFFETSGDDTPGEINSRFDLGGLTSNFGNRACVVREDSKV